MNNISHVITTVPKPFVFVLMPLSEDFTDIYQLGIKTACDDAGTYCERVDEQIFHESILQRIYNQIAKADIIVADMTDRNPNVFYEVGYAHALGKNVILLTQTSEDIPFDLKHYPHIIYGKHISDLKVELERRIRWYVDNPSRTSLSSIELVEVYIAGVNITDNVLVEIRALTRERWGQEEVILNLDLYNPTERVIDLPHQYFGLVFPEGFLRAGGSGIILPDKRMMFNLRASGTLLPKAWHTIRFEFFAKKEQIQEMKGYECVSELRRYTEIGIQVTPFRFLISSDIQDEQEEFV